VISGNTKSGELRRSYMALVDATAAAFRFAALNVSALRRTAGTYIWHRAQ
jgi:hypothetical protein